MQTPILKNLTLHTVLEQHQPDTIDLAETNVPWDIDHCRELKIIVNLHWPHHRSISSHCSPDPALPPNETHLPGGSLQLTHGEHSGQIQSFHSDKCGRWTSQSPRLKNNKCLTVITAHCPCDTTPNPLSNIVVQ